MRLKLIERLPPRGKHRRGIFECACGTKKAINIDNVRPSKTESCGCLRRETMQGLGKANRTHGGTGTAELTAYIQAKSRCHDANRHDYAYYGGRGIRFLYKSFEQFLKDVGPKPSAILSLDRINNSGNYEPGNCRWADAKIQRNNQRARSSH